MRASPAPLQTVPEDEQQFLCRYARTIADAMELRDWTVMVEVGELPEENQRAISRVAPARKIVWIRFREGAGGDDPELIRHDTVHELVHAHLGQATRRVHTDIQNELAPATFRVFWNGFETDVEIAVDALAAALARHLPLP